MSRCAWACWLVLGVVSSACTSRPRGWADAGWLLALPTNHDKSTLTE